MALLENGNRQQRRTGTRVTLLTSACWALLLEEQAAMPTLPS